MGKWVKCEFESVIHNAGTLYDDVKDDGGLDVITALGKINARFEEKNHTNAFKYLNKNVEVKVTVRVREI